MKLRDALKVSEVEHELDGNENHKVGAKRPYKSVQGAPGAAKRKTDERMLVAHSMNEFSIVWADTMEKISENMKFWETDWENVTLLEFDDWEPL